MFELRIIQHMHATYMQAGNTERLITEPYVTERKKQYKEQWQPDRGSFREWAVGMSNLPTKWWYLEGGQQCQVHVETPRNGHTDWAVTCLL